MTLRREPIFNVPAVILLLAASFVAVHLVREFWLSSRDNTQFLLLFAFIPARYEPAIILQAPGGLAASVWTFVSYAFIHGNLSHLLLNGFWMLAFGTPVARRFGGVRFLLFFALTAAAGAAAHLAIHAGQFVPVIGASAAVSGSMAAAIRFVFQAGGPLSYFGGGENAYWVPAAPLSRVLRDPRVVIFLAVWLGLNLLFGLGIVPVGDDSNGIAWEAHIGGFVTGLVAFSLFDPVRPDEEQRKSAA